MSNLSKVVGAILRDITDARSQADLQAREISRLYAADAILRYFPVPRAEVQDIRIELKFAVHTEKIRPGTGKVDPERFGQVLEQFSRSLSGKLQKTWAAVIHEDDKYVDLKKDLLAKSSRAQLQAKVMETLETQLKPEANLPDKNGLSKTLLEQIQPITPPAFVLGSFELRPQPGGSYKALGMQENNQPRFEFTALFENPEKAETSIRSFVETINRPGTRFEHKVAGAKVAELEMKDQRNNVLISGVKVMLSGDEGRLSSSKLGEQLKADLLKTPARKAGGRLFPIRVTQPGVNPRRVNPELKMLKDESLHEAAAMVLQSDIQDLLATLKRLQAEEAQIDLEVIIEPERLKDLPVESISTLVLQTDVRNYAINEDGDVKHLIPER